MHKLALLSHKCGTLYVRSILSELCKRNGYELLNFRKLMQHTGKAIGDIELEDKANTITFFPSSRYERVFGAVQGSYKGFHLVRDPRDIVVSGYFSHKYSHPVDGPWGQSFLMAHREWLLSVSESEGIMKEIEIAFALKTFVSWKFDDPNILELKFEDLLNEPVIHFERIFDFIQFPFNKRALRQAIRKYSFEKRTGRKPGQEDQYSHLRKGVPGDWVNYFSADHKAYFKEKWGTMVPDLGYEPDNNW